MKFNHELRWLYIDLNSFFASVEQQIEPRIRNRPVAIIPVMSDTTCAIAASYEAKAFGIKTGTPIWEAKKLCKDLILMPARHDAYVEYHHKVLKEVENHLPVYQICSIDEAACKLMDNENDPEVARNIALRIKKGISKNVGVCLKSSIGIAPNKYLAKIATNMQKPDGLTVLTMDDIPHKLHSLTFADIPGIGKSMEVRLRRHGIGTMEELLKLSPKHMRQIWHSVWGEKMYHMLRGTHIEEPETKRSTVGHSHVITPELRAPEKAYFIAKRLTLKAASRLRRMNFCASSFVLTARIENGPYWGAQIKCYQAQDNETFMESLKILWRALMEENPGIRVKKISVTLENLKPCTSIQPELFDTLNGSEAERKARALKLSNTLDSLNHKFGRDTVTLGMLPSQGRSFSGTKIAFTRIPDAREFLE